MGTVFPACYSFSQAVVRDWCWCYLRLQVASTLRLVKQGGGLGQSRHDQQAEQDGHHCSERRQEQGEISY